MKLYTGFVNDFSLNGSNVRGPNGERWFIYL